MAPVTDALERTPDSLADDPSWQRFRSVEAGVPEMAYQTDTDGIIRWASASSVDLLGWPPESLVGLTVEEARIKRNERMFAIASGNH